MPEILKILGQSNPLATTLTNIYTVPASTSAMVSTVTVCNRSNTSTSFRLSTAINGAVDSLQQYRFYDTVIGKNETKTYTIGMGLSAGDVVRVYATNAVLSFNLDGAEYT